MKKFIKIKDEKELNEFLDDVWNFHDGVISKANYTSGSSGDTTGTVPFDINPRLILRIEGCHYNETTINGVELLFEGVTKVFIAPTKENYTCNIMGANIVLKDNKFTFVNDTYYNVDEINTDETCYCYVAAKKLSYRRF